MHAAVHANGASRIRSADESPRVSKSRSKSTTPWLPLLPVERFGLSMVAVSSRETRRAHTRCSAHCPSLRDGEHAWSTSCNWRARAWLAAAWCGEVDEGGTPQTRLTDCMQLAGWWRPTGTPTPLSPGTPRVTGMTGISGVLAVMKYLLIHCKARVREGSQGGSKSPASCAFIKGGDNRWRRALAQPASDYPAGNFMPVGGVASR
jgi:hypothetical protein